MEDESDQLTDNCKANASEEAIYMSIRTYQTDLLLIKS